MFDVSKTRMIGRPYGEKLWQYVKPFSSDTGALRTDRRTAAISISRVSVLTRDKNWRQHIKQRRFVIWNYVYNQLEKIAILQTLHHRDDRHWDIRQSDAKQFIFCALTWSNTNIFDRISNNVFISYIIKINTFNFNVCATQLKLVYMLSQLVCS